MKRLLDCAEGLGARGSGPCSCSFHPGSRRNRTGSTATCGSSGGVRVAVEPRRSVVVRRRRTARARTPQRRAVSRGSRVTADHATVGDRRLGVRALSLRACAAALVLRPGRASSAGWSASTKFGPADADLFVYFNNDGNGCAVRDAVVFTELARAHGIGPPASPTGRRHERVARRVTCDRVQCSGCSRTTSVASLSSRKPRYAGCARGTARRPLRNRTSATTSGSVHTASRRRDGLRRTGSSHGGRDRGRAGEPVEFGVGEPGPDLAGITDTPSSVVVADEQRTDLPCAPAFSGVPTADDELLPAAGSSASTTHACVSRRGTASRRAWRRRLRARSGLLTSSVGVTVADFVRRRLPRRAAQVRATSSASRRCSYGCVHQGVTVEPEQVEQHVRDREPRSRAGGSSTRVVDVHAPLQTLEVGPALVVERDDLAVEDASRCAERGAERAQLGIAARDVVAVAGDEPIRPPST